jgi:hypothetical protein
MDSPNQETLQIMDARITCETCGDSRHSGNAYPTTQEEALFIGNGNSNNSGSRQQQGWSSRPSLPFGQQGNNSYGNLQPSLKDIWFGHKQINDNISKKFLANDKVMESLANQIEGFHSVIKSQLSFNKMVETQIAQLAASFPNPNMGRLPGQPEVPMKEHVSAIITRAGKTTWDLSPLDAGTRQHKHVRETKPEDEEDKEEGTTPADTEMEEAPRASGEYRDPLISSISRTKEEVGIRQAVQQIHQGN